MFRERRGYCEGILQSFLGHKRSVCVWDYVTRHLNTTKKAISCRSRSLSNYSPANDAAAKFCITQWKHRRHARMCRWKEPFRVQQSMLCRSYQPPFMPLPAHLSSLTYHCSVIFANPVVPPDPRINHYVTDFRESTFVSITGSPNRRCTEEPD